MNKFYVISIIIIGNLYRGSAVPRMVSSALHELSHFGTTKYNNNFTWWVILSLFHR